VAKSKKQKDMLDDLKKTFDNLHKYKMILNPKKCVFGVSLANLLDYMVLSRGIDANLKNVEAIK
jgi:predicted outer membrane protein